VLNNFVLANNVNLLVLILTCLE